MCTKTNIPYRSFATFTITVDSFCTGSALVVAECANLNTAFGVACNATHLRNDRTFWNLADTICRLGSELFTTQVWCQYFGVLPINKIGVLLFITALRVFKKTILSQVGQFNKTRITTSRLFLPDVLEEILGGAVQERRDSVSNLMYLPTLSFQVSFLSPGFKNQQRTPFCLTVQRLFQFERPVTWPNSGICTDPVVAWACSGTAFEKSCSSDANNLEPNPSVPGTYVRSCSRTNQWMKTNMGAIKSDAFWRQYGLVSTVPSIVAVVRWFFFCLFVLCCCTVNCLGVVEQAKKLQNAFKATKFPASYNIQDMLRFGFVPDNGTLTLNFQKYYEQCAPSKCTYTETRTKLPLEILATLVGLIGGVATVAAFFVDKLLPICCKSAREKDENEGATRKRVVSASVGKTPSNGNGATTREI